MKKSFLVILALVIALTLVIGSVSTVSAAPPAKFSVSITNVTVGATVGAINFTYQWDKLGVEHGHAFVYKYITSPTTAIQIYSNFNWWGPDGIITRQNSGSSHIESASIVRGAYYQVAFVLYGRNEKLLGTYYSSWFYLHPGYTVTFNETNGVSGAYIYIFTDPAHTNQIGLIVTNSSGQAAKNLSDGTYYYNAIRTGYLHCPGDFTVSGAPLTENFTMTAINTVTFSEVNDLEGVSIDVYSDAGRTDLIAALSTNGTGEATYDFINGTYYYTATRTFYGDLLGDFTVSGAPLTVDFTMALQIFAEDFTDVGSGEIPVGWNETAAYPNWGVSTSWAQAGGTTPEMVFSWEPSFDGISRLITPEIDASAYTDIGLTFKHFVDHFASPYTLRVQVSVNGGINWADAWSVSPTGNIGPATVTVDLSAYDGLTFQLAWVFDGNSWNIDYWDIDDISVTGS